MIKPEDLFWRPSNLMRIPNADYLERTKSENLGARLWRLPPGSANTLHKHVRAEEFYFVLEGTGRMRVAPLSSLVEWETLTVTRYGGVLVGPDQLRQVFNDTGAEVLWLIIGAPEEVEFLQGSKMDLSSIYPVEPTQLPKELAGVEWPPKSGAETPEQRPAKEIDFRQHAREWIEAWNAHDLERILGYYADEVEFISPFVVKLTGRGDGRLRGKGALRDYFARGLQTYPELRFELIGLYASERSCVVEYRSINHLRAAETMEFDSEGRVCRVLAHYRPD